MRSKLLLLGRTSEVDAVALGGHSVVVASGRRELVVGLGVVVGGGAVVVVVVGTVGTLGLCRLCGRTEPANSIPVYRFLIFNTCT